MAENAQINILAPPAARAAILRLGKILRANPELLADLEVWVADHEGLDQTLESDPIAPAPTVTDRLEALEGIVEAVGRRLEALEQPPAPLTPEPVKPRPRSPMGVLKTKAGLPPAR